MSTTVKCWLQITAHRRVQVECNQAGVQLLSYVEKPLRALVLKEIESITDDMLNLYTVYNLPPETRLATRLRSFHEAIARMRAHEKVGKFSDIPEAILCGEPRLEKRHCGYIYILKATTQLWKIGRTENLTNRLASLERECKNHGIDFTLRHFITTNDIARAENDIHDLVAEMRVRGEWFDLSESQFAVLQEIDHLQYKVSHNEL